MALGVLNGAGESPPGTVVLYEQDLNTAFSAFKHGHGKDSNIVLSPQPSNSPNDPLNWPLYKKNLTYFTVFLNSILLASIPAPSIAPATFLLANKLGRPLEDIAKLSGYQLLLCGCFGPIVSALAHKYGKRPQFLLASLMGVIGTVICIASGENYNVLLAGRIIQGFGSTAYESLSIAVIGDLFFVHQRSLRTGLTVLTLTCLVSLVAIIGGPITENLGWRYLFIIYLPFSVVGAVAAFFFLPETQYRRESDKIDIVPEERSVSVRNGQQAGQDDVDTTANLKRESRSGNGSTKLEHTHVESKGEKMGEGAAITVSSSSTEKKKTFVQELALFSGVYTETGLFKLLLAPFATLLNPSVVWSIFVGGVCIAFYVSLSYILAQIFSVPPYNLNAAQNGYFYVGALIGGLISGILGSMLGDLITTKLTKWNNGIYEPEFRIPVLIFSALLYGIGWFVFMWRLDHPTPHGYYLAAFCHGCLCAAVTIGSTATSLYILDSFRTSATEVFIVSMTTKNLLFYGFSNFINDWAAEEGPSEVLKTYGIVTLCIMVTSIPIYVFGKIIRRLIMRVGIMEKLAKAYV
ncbi:serine/threonine kinase 16 [Cadophora sp. MPI-SDFR-AT-0126]|nr:serine/threonine kinase 16 [Leotiomycetes sp. MPI-SDFR-AT-0126]